MELKLKHTLAIEPKGYSHSYGSHWSVTNTITITGENITYLNCIDRGWLHLNVSKFPALRELHCYGNHLTNLDLSKNTALTILYCHYNQLTKLDVSKNTALTDLSCIGNQLTSLDVSKNTALKDLLCINNQLSASALDALFGTLHSNTILDKIILVNGNPGADACNPSIATKKGWKVVTHL